MKRQSLRPRRRTRRLARTSVRRVRRTTRDTSLLAPNTTINWNVLSQNTPRFKNTLAMDNKPYTVIQSSQLGTVLASDSVLPQFYGLAVGVGALPQFSSYAAVFDQYRIDQVEIWMRPYGTATQLTYTNNSSARPNLYSVVDYDNATPPSSIAGMTAYTNCVTTDVSEGHYVKFTPHIASAVYGSGAFTSYANSPSGWIDCVSNNVAHYGFKAAVDPTVNSGDVRIELSTRVTVSFRNPY